MEWSDTIVNEVEKHQRYDEVKKERYELREIDEMTGLFILTFQCAKVSYFCITTRLLSSELIARKDSNFDIGHLGDLTQQFVTTGGVTTFRCYIDTVHYFSFELVKVYHGTFGILLE